MKNSSIHITGSREQWFLLLVLLTPFRELFLVLSIMYTVYLALRREYVLAVMVFVSFFIYLSGFPSVALLLFGGVLVFSGLLGRRFLFVLGVLSSLTVTYYALREVAGDYVTGLTEAVKTSGSTGILGFHLIIVLTVFAYVLAGLDWFKDSRIAGFIRENPHGFPAVLFLVFLVSAAVYLGLGDEGLANVYAELAYYSLVISVSLALPLLREDDEYRGGSDA